MQKNHTVFLFTILMMALTLSNLTAQKGAAADIQPLPEGVSIHQLDNGIQVLLIENPALPMVGVNTVVKVGSAYETFKSSGMSHMLEHLLFNGTTTMTQKELYDATDKIGGYNNANTSDYYTNYMMVTPFEQIEAGMKIQAGMLFDSVLPDEKFEKEKGIVLEEIAKSLARPQEQEERNITSVIYSGHALSLPTLGTYETIKSMVRDDVNGFYKNYYVPNNMVMSVIGNFKTDEMLKMLQEIYGQVKPGNVELPESPVWGIGFEKPKSNLTKDNKIFHKFYKGENTKLQLFFGLPNMSLDFYSMLDKSLEKQKDKLQEKLDKKFPDKVKTIEFQIRSYAIKSCLQATLVLNEETQMTEIKNMFAGELKKLDLKLSKDDVESETIKTKTSFFKNIEKPHMFGIFNAGLIAEYGLESIIAAYSGDGIKLAGEELKNFSIDSDPVIIVQHPAVSSSEDEVSSQIKIELFENSQNSPVVIAKQNSASELLAIHYMIKNKSTLESKYGKDASRIWHDAFGQRMKSEKNQKASMRFGFSFTVNDNPYFPMDNIYLSPEFGYIRVEGLGDDIESAINYLNNEMLKFIPTKEEFNKASKSAGMIGMMGGKDKSKELFDKTYKALIYEEEKNVSPAGKLTYEQLLEFGKIYFTPTNMIISVVSSAEPSDINNYYSTFVTKKSVDLPKGLAYQRGFVKIDQPQRIEETGGGEQSHLFYGYIKDFGSNEKPALQALALLLKDEIVFDIREKQGMAYRMSAGIDLVKDKALFFIKLPTLPKNVDKLTPQFSGFFTPDFAEKIDENSLAKSVNMYLGRMMFRRLSSINQAYYLAYSYYFYGNINEDRESLDKLKNVTVDEVRQVTEKYLNVENPIEVIVR